MRSRGGGRRTASGGRQSAGADAALTMSAAVTIETGAIGGIATDRERASGAAGMSGTDETVTGDAVLPVQRFNSANESSAPTQLTDSNWSCQVDFMWTVH